MSKDKLKITIPKATKRTESVALWLQEKFHSKMLTITAACVVICDQCGRSDTTQYKTIALAIEGTTKEGWQHNEVNGTADESICPECLTKGAK
jgi:hypothetical protein